VRTILIANTTLQRRKEGLAGKGRRYRGPDPGYANMSERTNVEHKGASAKVEAEKPVSIDAHARVQHAPRIIEQDEGDAEESAVLRVKHCSSEWILLPFVGSPRQHQHATPNRVANAKIGTNGTLTT
jgi:hypothetical protein